MTVRREMGALAALIVGAVIVFAITQNPISFDGGVPWDAAIYHDVARQFAEGLPIRGDAPFVFRIGEPAVAGLVAGGHINGFFHVVDLASAALGAVLLWIFLRWHVHRPIVRLSLVGVFLGTYVGPLRFGIFYPGLTYPVFWCFLVGGLVAIEWSRRRRGAAPAVVLAVLMFAGTMTRESMLLLVPVVFLARGPRWSTQIIRGTVSLAAGAAALFVTHALVTATGPYTFSAAAEQSIRSVTVPGFVVACAAAYGVALVVVALDARRATSMLVREPHLAALLVGAGGLALLGGTNTELFLMWGAPAMYAVAGYVIESRWEAMTRPSIIGLLVAAEVLLGRLLWPIPDYPGGDQTIAVLTAWGSNVRYFDLWSKFADDELLRVAAIEIVLVVIVGWIILQVETRRGSRSRPERLPQPRPS